MKTNDIVKAIKDGTIFRKIHHRIRIYYLRDSYPINLVEQSNDYRKLKKKYQYVLDRDVVEYKTTSNEKIIWVCWLQGIENAPDIVKLCVKSIINNAGTCKVILLDSANIKKYVQFPDYIEDKYKKGIISRAHYSDLVRLQLICKYGGLWIDSTVLCTSKEFIQYITELPLFVLRNTDYSDGSTAPSVLSNWLISGQPNQSILLKTQELLLEYWRKENRAVNYYIFHLFFTMASRVYLEDWSQVPVYDNHSAHILRFELENPYDKGRFEQILRMSPIHKLTHHVEPNIKLENTLYKKIMRDYGE